MAMARGAGLQMLKDHVAVVAGGSRGAGRGIARALPARRCMSPAGPFVAVRTRATSRTARSTTPPTRSPPAVDTALRSRPTAPTFAMSRRCLHASSATTAGWRSWPTRYGACRTRSRDGRLDGRDGHTVLVPADGGVAAHDGCRTARLVPGQRLCDAADVPATPWTDRRYHRRRRRERARSDCGCVGERSAAVESVASMHQPADEGERCRGEKAQGRGVHVDASR